MLVHIVSTEGSDRQRIVKDYEIKDGKIKIRVYDPEDEYGDSYHDEWIAVEIDKSYLVEIQAKFVINPKDKDEKAPLCISRGMREIMALAYTYSIVIVEYLDSYTLYDGNVVYSACGMKETRGSMYSYHHFDDNNKIVYDATSLAYEVEGAIDLYEILLKEHE